MALVLKKATATATNAHGKPLADYGIKDADGKLIKSLKYPVEWYEYENEQTMVDAKDELTLKEQLKVRNVERKTTARQAANTAALAAIGVIKPNEENDSQIRLKTVFKGYYAKLIGQGMAADEARIKARAKAAEFLEEEWADDGDEDEDA